MSKPTREAPATTARYDSKLKKILHTAAKVFAEKGFHNASIRDISSETGVSLAGLYYYFHTKEELLFLILDDAFDSVLGNLDASLQQHNGPHQVRFFVENHLRYFVDNLAEMKVLSHEIDSLSGIYRSRIRVKRKAYFKRLVDILSGQPLPKGARKPKVDSKLAALALFGMINWIYTWYHPVENRRIEPVINAMSEIFLRGYLSSTPTEPHKSAGEL